MGTCKVSLGAHKARPRKPVATMAAALALLLVTSLVLTGCSLRVETDTKVNDDGSGTVAVRLAADKELQQTISEALGSVAGPDTVLGGLADILGALGGIVGRIGGVFGLPTSVDEVFDSILGRVAPGWQMDRGTDDAEWRYVDLRRSFADPQEYVRIVNEGVLSNIVRVDEVSLSQERGIFRTKTIYSTTASASEALTGLRGRALGITEQMLGDALVIENRLTLPGTIKKHNADRVEGDTLVWRVGLSGSKQMHAESATYNWAPIIGVVVGALVVIAVITVALILILRRRRHRRPNPPVQPSAVHAAPAPIAPPTSAAATTVPRAAPPASQPPAASNASAAAAAQPPAGPDETGAETAVIELMPVAVTGEATEARDTGGLEIEPPEVDEPTAGLPTAEVGGPETPLTQGQAAPSPAAPAPVVPIPQRPDKAPPKPS